MWLDAVFASANSSFKMLVCFVPLCFYGVSMSRGSNEMK